MHNFVNKTKSFWPEGKADIYISFFPYKNEEIFYGDTHKDTSVFGCSQSHELYQKYKGQEGQVVSEGNRKDYIQDVLK